MKIVQKLFMPLLAAAMLFSFNAPVLAAGLAIPSNTTEQYSCEGKTQAACLKDNPIVTWINFFVNLFAVIIFIGATAMLIFAGIEYTSAGDNAQKIQAAKQRITNVIIGLIAFFFLYAFMQWLIPGGVF